jgi:hypothetical protein
MVGLYEQMKDRGRTVEKTKNEHHLFFHCFILSCLFQTLQHIIFTQL